MERLQMLDDVRKYANLLMKKDPNLDYASATKKAKLEMFGIELNIPSYGEVDDAKEKKKKKISYASIAEKELGDMIRIELYTDEQLKEIIIAKRMGIHVEEFINIFYTPKQIRVITMASALGQDITSYTTNLYFDADQELEKLSNLSEGNDENQNPKTYVIEPAA